MPNGVLSVDGIEGIGGVGHHGPQSPRLTPSAIRRQHGLDPHQRRLEGPCPQRLTEYRDQLRIEEQVVDRGQSPVERIVLPMQVA